MGSSCCAKKPTDTVQVLDDVAPCSSPGPPEMAETAPCCAVEEQCDEACLPIAAAMIAERTRPVKSCDDSISGDRDGSSDGGHYMKTLEKLRRLLESARCICHSVVEAGNGISCCTKKAAAGANASSVTNTSKACSSLTSQKQSGCCASKPVATASCCDKGDNIDGRNSSTATPPPELRPSGCCSSAVAPRDGESRLDCGGKAQVQAAVGKMPLDCCPAATKQSGGCSSPINTKQACDSKYACCVQPTQKQSRGSCPALIAPKPSLAVPKTVASPQNALDSERTPGFEHVALSVDGMTCNDCASKLDRTLTSMPGVHNVGVNFIRGTADFTVDPANAGADDVLKRARAATGFELTRMAGGISESIELLVPESSARAIAYLDIEGLEDVTVLNKTTIRISYDPDVIGARELLESLGDIPGGLAPPATDPALSGGRRRFYFLLLMTVLAAAMTIPVVVMEWSEGLVSEHRAAIASFVLGTFVQLLAVPIFYKPALRALILYRALELDMLVVVSITAAYTYSVVAFGFRIAGSPLDQAEFFETSTLLITLIMLGRLLASYARIRAVAAVSLRSLQSTTTILVAEHGDQEIDTRLLQYGDRFRVLPHCRIPTDGAVLEGDSDVNESMLTGESLPVLKQKGSNVIAGTINTSGVLLVELTRLPGRNTVVDIARMVEEASNSKPRIQDLADRVASYFLPVVGIISALVFVIWAVVGITAHNEAAGDSVSSAITYAIAVLAVSCPCALGLAVPMVLVIAGGISARGGVIVKSAECTERSRKVTDVVFDKTGTLTEPDLDVLEVVHFTQDQSEALGVTKALVSENTHPVSAAVGKYLAETFPDLAAASITDIQSVPGSGVEAARLDHVVRAGNASWTKNDDASAVRQFVDAGLTVLLVTRDRTPLVLYGLRTRIRAEAANVVSALQSRDITVHLVSGDHPRAVQSIASSIGIDRAHAVARYKPDQKRAYVAALMESKKYVLFCGDGTNDAVAVAQANIGVQLSNDVSSDVTQAAADVVLLSGLNGIPFLLDVSRAAFRRIVFNFVWSAAYNVLAVLLAAGAFVRIRIPPAYAGLGELVSVLPVIAAAMSMLALKLKP